MCGFTSRVCRSRLSVHNAFWPDNGETTLISVMCRCTRAVAAADRYIDK